MRAVGKKIRTIRLSKEWTLADLAKRAGVALSSLSRMEAGQMTGTLESHISIAKALGVRLPELYSELEPTLTAIEWKAKESPEKFHYGKGCCLTLLASGALRKKMLPVLISLQTGKSTPQEQSPSGTEKFIYGLAGRVAIEAGNQRVQIKAGDSAYLQASLSHLFKNTGPGMASILVLSSPPTV